MKSQKAPFKKELFWILPCMYSVKVIIRVKIIVKQSRYLRGIDLRTLLTDASLCEHDVLSRRNARSPMNEDAHDVGVPLLPRRAWKRDMVAFVGKKPLEKRVLYYVHRRRVALISEEAVQPLIQFQKEKKRQYHPPSRQEIFCRCVRLSREIRAQPNGAGQGVDLGRSSGKNAPENGRWLDDRGSKRSGTLLRTSLGQNEKLEENSREGVAPTKPYIPEGQDQEGTLSKRVCPNPPIAKSKKLLSVSSGGP
jgi:hypothetical protein